MKIKDIKLYLESIAPTALQENYDNSGLIVGNDNDEVNGAILTLDCTEEVVDEAIAKKVNLIIAHHPIIFSGIKKLNGNNYFERTIIKAIKNNIAIYAAHTNYDNIKTGVNAIICEKLGLSNLRILAPKSDMLRKLVTFSPKNNATAIREALSAAGAGAIGNYEQCSFTTEGVGTFMPNEMAKPYIGKVNELHHEDEIKIEMVFPFYLEAQVLGALRNSHPYEEIAFEIYALRNFIAEIGSGMIGEFVNPISELDFLSQLKTTFNLGCIKHTNLMGKSISKVAVCGGSGSFLLKNAIASNADIYITSDFKYHEFFDAENKIVIADIGHFESEQFTPQLFYNHIIKNFPTFAAHLSKVNTNPIKYF
jgi:dinuclear metal center YbgI/SA1388 family protein